jgi:hypothetical protein
VTRQGDAAGRPRRGSGVSTATEEALVARLRMLSEEFDTSPDEEFRAATRARLVAIAAVRTPAAEAPSRRPVVHAGAVRRLLAGATGAPTPRRRSRLTAGLAGSALAVVALGGVFAGAQSASPGDLLYDLKRGGEQTQLVLAGDSTRGPTLLGFATTRLDELGALVGVQPDAAPVVGTTPSGGETGLAAGPDVDLVLDTLQTMDTQTTEGTSALTSYAVQASDADALEVLTGWAADQSAGLGEVGAQLPAGARAALAGSRELVDRVAARGSALEEALGCASGPATAGADELGPLPAGCAPVVPPVPDRTVVGPVRTGEPTPTTAAPGTDAPGTTTPSGPTTTTPGTAGSTTTAAPTTAAPTTTGPTTGPSTGPTTTGSTPSGSTSGSTSSGSTSGSTSPGSPTTGPTGAAPPTGTAAPAPSGTAGGSSSPPTAAPPVPSTGGARPTPSSPRTGTGSRSPAPTPPPDGGSSTPAAGTSSGPVSPVPPVVP